MTSIVTVYMGAAGEAVDPPYGATAGPRCGRAGRVCLRRG
jgi:hypothetical protein